jgi:hypothetical protein
MQTDGEIMMGKIMDSEIIHPRHILEKKRGTGGPPVIFFGQRASRPFPSSFFEDLLQ